jgi:hypothetical protein
MNYFPVLASNQYPPNLSLPNYWDYSREPPVPGVDDISKGGGAHLNPSYSGGRQEDDGSRPARQNLASVSKMKPGRVMPVRQALYHATSPFDFLVCVSDKVSCFCSGCIPPMSTSLVVWTHHV